MQPPFAVFSSVLALCLLVVPLGLSAQDSVWDRAANIRAAATEIGRVQKNEGRFGVDSAIENCYLEHVIEADRYTKQVETCLTQDILHSRFSAAIFARLSPAVRQAEGTPEPEAVMKEMAQRVGRAFSQTRVAADSARDIVKDIEVIGEPVFWDAMLAGD